jgi:hypothetical protein
VIAWTPVTRAIALTLSLLVAGSTAARADCKPTALTEGDPALVQSLASQLAASGIATTPAAGCPVIRVSLEQRGTQLHLRLADAFERQSTRDVRDLATAVAIIESWTTQEIEAGTLPAEVTAETAPPVPISRSQFTGAGLAATSSLGTDGTTWVGAALGGCARLGSTCAGGALRADLDTAATGPSATVSQDTFTLAAYATIDLPRALGGFIISPGIGAGYGFQYVTTRHHGAMGAVDVASSDHELRLAAHCALLRPITAHWSAFADLWADAGALRSDSQFGPTAALRLALGFRLEAP